MSLILKRKRLFLTYMFFVLWLGLIFVGRTTEASWIVLALFLFFLFWPGFFIIQILRLNAEVGVGRLAFLSAISFVYSLSLSFLAIILGITVQALIALLVGILIILAVLS